MRVVFASYGNDSIALIRWAADQGYADQVLVAYSDTGWSAPFWSDRILEAEEWVISLGFHPVRIASEGMAALIRRKKAWPRGGGGKFQFCTQELKQRPALAWLDSVDPQREAVCLVGVRREESPNRAQFPEWTEESERHGGRSLYAPLVTYTAAQRNELLKRTPFDPLPYRSKECYPCVNAGKRELRLLDEDTIAKIEALEAEMGTNSKGNERVMFSSARHGGSVGIRAVVADAQRDNEELFATHICDGGWCE